MNNKRLTSTSLKSSFNSFKTILPNSEHLLPISFDDQIILLKKRGMIFNDEERAKKYLSYIGYHRLSIFWNKFYDDENKTRFKNEINFNDVLSLYIFNRKLRCLFFEASERIEVCIKVLASDILSNIGKNPFWYNDSSYFNKNKPLSSDVKTNIESDLRKDKNLKFIDISKTPIPSWILVNYLTFGKFSKIIEIVSGNKLTELYSKFNLPKRIFDNWLKCICYVRNICAHYGELYNHSFSITPVPLNGVLDQSFKNTFYAQYIVYCHMMDIISPTSSWKNRITKLVKEYSSNPLFKIEDMGFPEKFFDNI